MIDNWDEFLSEQRLTMGSQGHSYVADENVDLFQKLTGEMICDVSHTSLVRVQGEEAGSFLQNQLSSDIESLVPTQTALAGYCNAKGRLISIFRVWTDADGYLLQMPTDMRDAVTERLRRYVLRAKVQLSAVGDLVAFGICGKTAAKVLEQMVGALPRNYNELVRGGNLCVIRLSGDGRPRFQIIGTVRSCKSAWLNLQKHAAVMGSWAWARLDILAGVPNIAPKTTESFVPQMVNLDLLGGVSFKKGCYPGQEIVARMHYLGNLKQRMARFRMDDQLQPQPGDRVYTRGTAAPTGTVVDAQAGPGSGRDLLAVVRLADLDRETLCVEAENGPTLFQQDLPYSITDPA